MSAMYVRDSLDACITTMMENQLNAKPTILVLCAQYLPAFTAGGPIRSVSNLVCALSDEFNFIIFTMNRDFMSNSAFDGLENGGWRQIGPARVRYLAAEELKFSSLQKIVSQVEYDILYLNSFFHPRFTFQLLLARRLGFLKRKPTVVAPRGEFSPGALALKSLRKNLYTFLLRKFGLVDGLFWHASTSLEDADIKARLGINARVRVALNLQATTEPMPLPLPRAFGSPLRIIFLSRISKMKNLAFALSVLTLVREHVEFRIFGPIEDEDYWATCLSAIKSLPANVHAVYCGMVEPEDVPTTFADHDLFFLPTLGENFGHAIAESLAAGTPVLISDQTPWRNLERDGLGCDLSLADPMGFAEKIDRYALEVDTNPTERRAEVISAARSRQNKVGAELANRLLFRACLR